MTSLKPYLIKAYRDWIIDNGQIPHIVVDTTVNHIRVPMQYASEGKITLNVSPSAALQYQMEDGYIRFSARFDSGLTQLVIPIFAVLSVYARESGQGISFEPESTPPEFDNMPEGSPPTSPSKPSFLKLVK
jgi:stringent starvation protein B